MPYIKESIITKLQKLYSLPKNLRVGNKSPALFLEKHSCTGNLLPMCKLFIESPGQTLNVYFNEKTEFTLYNI